MTNEEQNSAMGYTEGSDLPSAPFPHNPQVSAVDIQTVKDACTEFFFWWVNAKGTNTYQGFDEWAKTEKGAYRVSQLTALRAQLAASEKLCKELEQDNAAGFEILQEKQIVNTRLENRVKDLEDYLADRILYPTKSQIMMAIQKKWDQDPDRDIMTALDTVLDEIGIN